MFARWQDYNKRIVLLILSPSSGYYHPVRLPVLDQLLQASIRLDGIFGILDHGDLLRGAVLMVASGASSYSVSIGFSHLHHDFFRENILGFPKTVDRDISRGV